VVDHPTQIFANVASNVIDLTFEIPKILQDMGKNGTAAGREMSEVLTDLFGKVNSTYEMAELTDFKLPS
jgi:hypothetical protein